MQQMAFKNDTCGCWLPDNSIAVINRFIISDLKRVKIICVKKRLHCTFIPMVEMLAPKCEFGPLIQRKAVGYNSKITY